MQTHVWVYLFPEGWDKNSYLLGYGYEYEDEDKNEFLV